MKLVFNIVGILLISVGIVWSLQGANILPGSFMTGQIEWLIIGVVCLFAGAGLLVYNKRQDAGEEEP